MGHVKAGVRSVRQEVDHALDDSVVGGNVASDDVELDTQWGARHRPPAPLAEREHVAVLLDMLAAAGDDAEDLVLPRGGNPPESIGPFEGGPDPTLKIVDGQGGDGAGVRVNHAYAGAVQEKVERAGVRCHADGFGRDAYPSDDVAGQVCHVDDVVVVAGEGEDEAWTQSRVRADEGRVREEGAP